jgi:SnoaL-like domain
MKIDEMLAREAIRYTVGRYVSAVDRGAYEELADVFTPDGAMTFGGHASLTGHAQIISTMLQGSQRRGAFEGGNFQRHLLGHSIINAVDADSARGVHYILVMSEVGHDHSGVYIDDYVKSGERWLIAHRRGHMEWVNPNSRFSGFPGANPVPRDALNIWRKLDFG